MDKGECRARAIAARADLQIDSYGHCQAIAAFLASTVAADRFVLTFDAMPGEVDLSSLIADEPNPEDRFAITRTPDEGFVLTVHAYGCEMERHRYGYQQPTAQAPVLAVERIGAVLVPGLAFDRDGVRLGRGRGYYDRLLAPLGGSVPLVGVTGGYVVERLPAESFDVSMTHLATAAGVFPVPLVGLEAAEQVRKQW
ncbi:MAG: 5-formyltetrahydrofolate cyclo-ligase [Acidimicrobiales bacterium]